VNQPTTLEESNQLMNALGDEYREKGVDSKSKRQILRKVAQNLKWRAELQRKLNESTSTCPKGTN
jgi:hypothetical protein